MQRQRIQFGAAESLAKVALRGGLGGRFSYEVPRFGTRCVCCNADAMGRTQDYNPSTDRVEAAPIPMPVCFDCKDHALQTATAGIIAAGLLVVGVCAIALGISYLGERPGDGFLKGVIVVGAVLLIGTLAWIVAASRREQRERKRPGHHPRLSFSIDAGSTLLDTTNDTLVEELLALNPSARVLPTPLLWRLRRQPLPAARAVKAPPRAADDEGARLAAYIAADPPVAPAERRDAGAPGNADARRLGGEGRDAAGRG